MRSQAYSGHSCDCSQAYSRAHPVQIEPCVALLIESLKVFFFFERAQFESPRTTVIKIIQYDLKKGWLAVLRGDWRDKLATRYSMLSYSNRFFRPRNWVFEMNWYL